MSIPNLAPGYLETMRRIAADRVENEKQRDFLSDQSQTKFFQDLGNTVLSGLMSFGANAGIDAIKDARALPMEQAKLGGYEAPESAYGSDPAMKRAAEARAFSALRPAASYGQATETRRAPVGMASAPSTVSKPVAPVVPEQVEWLPGEMEAYSAPEAKQRPAWLGNPPAPVSVKGAFDPVGAGAKAPGPPAAARAPVVAPPGRRVLDVTEGSRPVMGRQEFNAGVLEAGRRSLPADIQTLVNISTQVKEGKASETALNLAEANRRNADASLAPDRQARLQADVERLNADAAKKMMEYVKAGVDIGKARDLVMKDAADASAKLMQRFGATSMGGIYKTNAPPFAVQVRDTVLDIGGHKVPFAEWELVPTGSAPPRRGGGGSGSGVPSPGASTDEDIPQVVVAVETRDKWGKSHYDNRGLYIDNKAIGAVLKNPRAFFLNGDELGRVREQVKVLQGATDAGASRAARESIGAILVGASQRRSGSVASIPQKSPDQIKAEQDKAAAAAAKEESNKKSSAENRFNSSAAGLSKALAGIKPDTTGLQRDFLGGLQKGINKGTYRVLVGGELVTVPGAKVQAMLRGEGISGDGQVPQALDVLRIQYNKRAAAAKTALDTERAEAWTARLPALRKAYGEMGGTGDLGDALRDGFGLTPPSGVVPAPSAPRAPQAPPGRRGPDESQSRGDPIDLLHAELQAMNKPASWKRRVFLAEARKRGWV